MPPAEAAIGIKRARKIKLLYQVILVKGRIREILELLKPSENPPAIWPSEQAIQDFTGQWWVAHTKSRNEKALAHDLLRNNINYFLPMAWKVHNSNGRKVRSLLPLFNGYLFFCGDEPQRLAVLRTSRVANLIEVIDQQRFLSDLSQIEIALRSDAVLSPHNYIKTGQLCRVIAGPLLGLKGIVIRTKTATRLVLQIDMLGQASSVEIDNDTIEVVDEAC